MSAGVIFNNQFIYNWHIGEHDYSDYASRDEAMTKSENVLDNIDSYSLMMNPEIIDEIGEKKLISDKTKDGEDKNQYDYFCYMRNEEKSDGIFDSTRDKLTEEEVNEFRKLELVSRSEGCPKYIGILSFENNFLRENNIIIGDQIDLAAIKNAARKGMNALIESSAKLDASNCYWSAAIHTNTDNVHIHYQLLEYHRLEDRLKVYRYKDMLDKKDMEKLKSVVASSLNEKSLAKDLTSFERDILQKQIKYAFQSDERKIQSLIKELPYNGAWQYIRLSKHTQNHIDSCVRSVIKSDTELSRLFDDYMKKIDEVQDKSRRNYGDHSRYKNYTESRLHGRDGFYSRVGNAFLKICKEYKEECRNDRANLSKKEIEIDYSFSEADIPPEDGYYDYPYEPNEEDMRIFENYGYDEGAYLSEKEIYDDATPPSGEDPVNIFSFSRDESNLSKKESDGRSYISWSLEYKEARKMLYDKNSKPGDIQNAEKTAFGWVVKAANQDNEYAQYSLGNMYFYGTSVEKDQKEALKWYKKSSDKGQPYASYAVGNFYTNGIVVDKDSEKAQKYYKLAFDGFKKIESDGAAEDSLLYKLGTMYKNGLGTAPDVDKAIEYFRRSAELNDPNAQFEMGKFFLSTDNKRQAYRYFKQSADSGHTFGAYYAGRILLENNAATDIDKGIELLKQAASNDCDAACYYLGCYYSQSDSPAAREQAVRYLSVSADSYDNSFAQYRLGKLYLSENKNKEAARYLRMSAENDNPYGQLVYGLLLHKQGQRKAATAWITKAAENGNPFARDVLKSLSQSRRGNITLNMSSAIRSQAAAQSRMMRKTSGMLRNALNSEEAKTAMMQFEREQELAEARKNGRKNIG